MKPSVSYEADLLRRLANREYAADFLTDCWEDGDDGVFLLAAYDVAKANGGLRQLAKKTGLNREHLFRMLSPGGNPTLSSMRQLVQALGFKLEFKSSRGGAPTEQHKRLRPTARRRVRHPSRRGTAHRLTK